MRILYLNPCGVMGGAETSLVELLASIISTEPEWDLWLVLGENGPLAEKARALGVNVVVERFSPSVGKLGDSGIRFPSALWSLPNAAVGALLYALRLSRLIELIRPDIIHTNGFKMHLLGAWARPRQVPLVWHIHDYVRKRPLMSRLLRLSRKRCSGAIVNSKSVLADLKSLIPELPATTIYNAVDLERFSPQGPTVDLDTLAGLAPAHAKTIRVGLVGTFARWKGHEVFLEALALLTAEVAIRGYIIGGPVYRTSGSQWQLAELQRRASELGLGGRIGFTGFLDDTAAAMRSLDIVAHASTEPEPFGMVIAEGMACGKAVIVSDAGGASELFRGQEDALAHVPGDSQVLAWQIVRLAGDEALRVRLGTNARNRAVELYGRTRLAKELLRVYAQVSGGQKSPGFAAEPRSVSIPGGEGAK